ncbi:hypothetical protein [Cohnella sp. GCM10012308]|uniref:hypothetical protein n=1 Tax=Cohnella sp. GCM10012308 TaxID=3317329 RepID=UPI00360A4E32
MLYALLRVRAVNNKLRRMMPYLFAAEELDKEYVDNQHEIMENQRRIMHALGVEPWSPAATSNDLTPPSRGQTARQRLRFWVAFFYARSAARRENQLFTNWRMKNMKKWFRPDVLTIIAGALVTGANQLLGLDIDPTNIVAAAVLLLGYFKAHEYVTVVRDANGLPTGYKLNSRKLIFTAIAFAFVVLDAIYKLGASIESIVALTTIITGYNWTEAKKDVKTAEAEGADARQAH